MGIFVTIIYPIRSIVNAINTQSSTFGVLTDLGVYELSELYNRIKGICDSRGIKITAMAQSAGVNPAMLSDLKHGRRKTMTLPTAQKIADRLEISVDYLLTGDDQKEKPAANEGHRLSVEERVEQILEGMSDDKSDTLMLDGKPASPEALDALRQAIKMGVEYARKINSEKK